MGKATAGGFQSKPPPSTSRLPTATPWPPRNLVAECIDQIGAQIDGALQAR